MASKKPTGKSRGRRSKYNKADIEKMIPKVVEWGRQGLIDSEIARKMGISRATLYNYKNKYKELDEALLEAKKEVDDGVEQRLLNQTKGYYIDEVKEFTDESGIVYKREKTRRYITPETKAMIFWLQNRRPDEWRERKDVNIEGELIIDVSLDGLDDDEETE